MFQVLRQSVKGKLKCRRFASPSKVTPSSSCTDNSNGNDDDNNDDDNDNGDCNGGADSGRRKGTFMTSPSCNTVSDVDDKVADTLALDRDVKLIKYSSLDHRTSEKSPSKEMTKLSLKQTNKTGQDSRSTDHRTNEKVPSKEMTKLSRTNKTGQDSTELKHIQTKIFSKSSKLKHRENPTELAVVDIDRHRDNLPTLEVVDIENCKENHRHMPEDICVGQTSTFLPAEKCDKNTERYTKQQLEDSKCCTIISSEIHCSPHDAGDSIPPNNEHYVCVISDSTLSNTHKEHNTTKTNGFAKS